MKKGLTNSKAFTLAEVIITLGIIGVVASMTIPVLMNAIQDANYKTAYKKAFSAANNAFKMATADGTAYVPMTSITDGVDACINWQIFSSQFKKSKECINSDTGQCWNTASGVETSNGAPVSGSYAFIDSSGMTWAMRGYCSGTGTTNSFFLVDTNGFKGPNKYGKDRWAFNWFLDNGTSGTPLKITIYTNVDYINGATDNGGCPTGPCYYKSWLLN